MTNLGNAMRDAFTKIERENLRRDSGRQNCSYPLERLCKTENNPSRELMWIEPKGLFTGKAVFERCPQIDSKRSLRSTRQSKLTNIVRMKLF